MADSYRIQISASLVDKLVSDGDKKKKKAKKSKSKIPKEQHKNKQKPTSPPPSNNSSAIWPVQPPVFLPPAPPPAPPALAELEAIRSILRQSEEVMKRLEEQEAHMTEELTQRAKDLREKEFKLPFQKSLPCVAEREACLQCYKEQQESKQPSKCSQVVRSFKDCVFQARQQKQQQANLAP